MKNLTKIILIFVCVFIASCKTDSLPNDIAFDSAKWKSGDSRTRGRMAHNLQHSSILANKTKFEVIGILGEPDDQSDSNNWFYKVDFGNGFGTSVMTPINFNVKFDEKTQRVIGTIFTDGQLFGIYMIIPLRLEFEVKK